jgi:hypothetical protein
MRTVVPFALSLLLPLAPLAAQEKVTLRYEFKPGQSVWVQTTQDMNMQMNAGGQEMKTTMSMSMWTECKTTEVKDGVATIENRYARVAVKVDGPGQKLDYDSDVEGSKAGPMGKSFADLVGKVVKMRVDAMGKVLECTMPEGLEDQLERAGLSKAAFDQQFVSWPKDPVAVGESWKSEFEMPMGQMGNAKTTVTNKLAAVKDKVATVEQNLEIDMSGLKSTGPKMELVKAGGVSKVGVASAMPVDGTMDIEMKMGDMMKMTQHMVIKQIEPLAPKKPAETPKKEEKKDEPKKDEPKKGDGK